MCMLIGSVGTLDLYAMFFLKFGEILIFMQILYLSFFPLFSSFGTLIVHMSICFILFWRSLRFCPYFLIEASLTYNIVLVSGIQHNLKCVYIADDHHNKSS